MNNNNNRIVLNSTLVDQLSSVLHCRPDELYIRLHDMKVREQAIAFLRLVKLETIHLRFNKPIKFSGLTYTGSRYLMAFRGFLHITVAQYYYAKHKLILNHMDCPNIIVMPTGANGDTTHQYEYYPLEVLRVVPNDDDDNLEAMLEENKKKDSAESN